jgi:uncharacterized protein
MSRPPRRNTEAEFEALERTCERLVGFDPELSLFGIDGWLTVLAAGPVRLPPEQWLELAFGDTFERVFADPADREQALASLEARLAVLRDELDAEALLDQPDALRLDPLADEWSDEDRAAAAADGATPEELAQLHTGALWAQGALLGIEALLPSWQVPETEDHRAAIEELAGPIVALLLEPGSQAWQRHLEARQAGAAAPQAAEPSREDLLADACFAVQDLRLFLLDYGPRPEPRHVAPTPGRNDPCPCGSGRKYKKCHGA